MIVHSVESKLLVQNVQRDVSLHSVVFGVWLAIVLDIDRPLFAQHQIDQLNVKGH